MLFQLSELVQHWSVKMKTQPKTNEKLNNTKQSEIMEKQKVNI